VENLKKKIETFLHKRENLKELRKICGKGKWSFVVDFDRLLQFDMELARDLVHSPEKFFKTADETLGEMTKLFGIHLRVQELDKTFEIQDLWAKHVGSFIQVQGVVEEVENTQLLKDETETDRFEDYQVVKVGNMSVKLLGDLVGKVRKGDKIVVTGILKAIQAAPQRFAPEGFLYDKLLEANHILVKETPQH